METPHYPSKSNFETLAIAQIVESTLLAAVNKYLGHNQVLKPQFIPVYRAKNCYRLYISSVAFVLSKALNIPPLEIAAAIASYLHQAQQDITATVVTPGFIHIEPTAPLLANWLQTLPFLPLLLAKSILKEYFSPMVNNSHLFYIQHAHARCCSLLCQAERDGMIALTEIEAQDKLRHLAIAHPQPLPWLGDLQQLRFCHPAEYALIGELVAVVDSICASSGKLERSWQAAFNLSQAFASFHSCCRIWGEVKLSEPQLAQARLGLILATQVVLQFLLHKRLGVFAPQEL